MKLLLSNENDCAQRWLLFWGVTAAVGPSTKVAPLAGLLPMTDSFGYYQKRRLIV